MIRVLSGLALGAVALSAVLWAPPGLLAALVLAVSLLGVREVGGLARAAGAPFPLWASLAGAVLVVGGAWSASLGGLAVGMGAGFILVALSFLGRGGVSGSLAGMGAGILSLWLPAGALAHALLLAALPQGRLLLLFLLAATVACDTAAFYFGTAFGRHRLAPAVSPKKSVEGLVAGIVAGAGVGAGFAALGWAPLPVPVAAAAGAVLALLGQLGDLTESLLKRDAGVKDSGNLIPGHGGILDRVDALLLTLPAWYYLLLGWESFSR